MKKKNEKKEERKKKEERRKNEEVRNCFGWAKARGDGWFLLARKPRPLHRNFFPHRAQPLSFEAARRRIHQQRRSVDIAVDIAAFED